MKFTTPPGVFDILPDDPKHPWRNSHLWNYVESVIRKTAKDYGFHEIRTPAFEKTELFIRGVGQTSDIVTKEMYTFEDKGSRSLTLRPEGTAPAIRAFIEHGLTQLSPVHKIYYIGPMFRYERSQAGRYRQHHQFGAEAIGNKSPEQDAEIIDLLYTLYQRLGLKNLKVHISSIGDSESRNQYKTALQDYLREFFDQLSEESQKRFETNPLRILDSKDEQDKKIAKGAPSILDFLNLDSKEHFEELKKRLTDINIPFQVNHHIVRGLDYYDKTVFEIISGELGAQNSIGGGGRYDGLMKSLGGPDLPALGFGTGIERIIQTMLGQNVFIPQPQKPALFMIPLDSKSKEFCFSFLHELREHHVSAEMDFSGRKLGKVMQYANQIGAQYVIVVGDQELNNMQFDLKKMETGNKETLSKEKIIEKLKS